MTVELDPDMGVTDRRVKDDEECAHLRQAQAVTEKVMRMACETVAQATATKEGELQLDGESLTSERLRTLIDTFLL